MPTDTLAGALAEVQAHLPTIAKTETATVRSDKGSYSYSYANLAQVSHAILPLLGKVGLAWICRPTLTEAGKMVLAYRLLHVSGEEVAGEYPLPATGTPQQIGGAITYARRYTLCSVTGVAPEQDDDDAAAASAPPTPRSMQRQARPGPAPTPAGEAAGEAAATRPVRRATPSAGGPPLPGEETPPPAEGPGEAPQPDREVRSEQQSKMLHVLFRQLDLERDDALAYCAGVLDREVTSTTTLTRAEASRVIESLQADAGGGVEA
jgi:hypothetical protein